MVTKWYKVEFEIGVSEDIPVNKAADLIIDIVHTSFPSNNNYTGPNIGRMIRVSTDHYTRQNYTAPTIEKIFIGDRRRTIDDDDKEELGIMPP